MEKIYNRVDALHPFAVEVDFKIKLLYIATVVSKNSCGVQC